MTVNNPPSYLQGDGPNAEQHRSHMTAAFGERPGVLTTDSLVVTERDGTANMSVDVSGGRVLVEGTEGTYQGLYLCHNRGVQNVAINTSDPANARYDLIIARVRDADYSGATNAWSLEAVQGTAAATPTFPTVPDNSFVLATVLVGASVSSIVDADITDIRTGSDTDGTDTLINRGTAAPSGVVVCTSSTRPSSPFIGMEIIETDTGETHIWTGSAWIWRGGGTTAWTTNWATNVVSATSSGAAFVFDITGLPKGQYMATATGRAEWSVSTARAQFINLSTVSDGGSATTVNQSSIHIETGGTKYGGFAVSCALNLTGVDNDVFAVVYQAGSTGGTILHYGRLNVVRVG